jgi:hypothetical protein
MGKHLPGYQHLKRQLTQRFAVCLLFAITVLQSNVHAQAVCGFDQANRALQKNDPGFTFRLAASEQKIRAFLQARKNSTLQKRETGPCAIPVVVHVLHTGEPVGTIYNPSDEQIKDAIDYLNEIYSGTAPTLTVEEDGGAGDMGLRFVLAQRDPQCNPTNGIDRIDMSANAAYMEDGATNTEMSKDLAMKTPIIWNKADYYNIYIVHKINGQDGTTGPYIAGYAYFPTSSNVDGTVMLATQMKAGSKTLVHEIGHAFYLYHPFEGSFNKDACPVGDGDMVDDTDPMSYNISSDGVIDFSCRTGEINKCNGNTLFSINTENNFMNYTTCYTLFTPGQKDRIQASLLLDDRLTLTRSSAAKPTYGAGGCLPKINFEKAVITVERATTITYGCRKYTDYTVNVTIANNPSKSTDVQIIPERASSAREGVDFSFPQGDTVKFPKGSHASQPFVIRVFNNYNASVSKELRLSFTVYSNGGNAIKGSAISNMRVIILPNDIAPIVPGKPGSVQIGVHTENISNTRLFDASVPYQKMQLLYLADEIKAAGITEGPIKGISFFIEKQTTSSFKNVYFKLGHTSLGNLVHNGQINIVEASTQVLALASYSTVDGWNVFKFTSPFIWNGVDNILIEICTDNGNISGSGYDVVHAYSNGEAETVGDMMYGAVAGCGQNFSSISYYNYGIKPIIKVDYLQPGNPVQNVVGSSSTEYLGPYGEVFFYDNSLPKKIIGKIKNLSDWNYGCINLKIDRGGNDAKAFWSRSQSQYLARKTFFVTPEHDNPSGKYEITLYYTYAEKAGYENTTGRKWEDVKIVKTEIPIDDINPDNPMANEVQIIPVKTRERFGEGYTITAESNTGFSGYGTGAIDLALPVTWLDMSAIVVNENVLVKWQTASEWNNDYFEVETSTDGNHFITLGKIWSKGTATNTTSYQYVHVQPAPGKIFYRIKQVDKDGTQSYSNIFFITLNTDREIKPVIYPVPAANTITINFGKEILNPAIEIFSSDLKPILHVRKAGRILKENLSITTLPAGTYIAKITFEGKNYVLRFVKL